MKVAKGTSNWRDQAVIQYEYKDLGYRVPWAH